MGKEKNQLVYSTETITPQLAQMYLDQCNLHNRLVQDKRVNFYANQMLKGNWELNGEGISFDTDNILTNGQHRLLAVIKANIPVEFTVIRNVSKDAFKTQDQGMNRKASDILYLAEIPNSCAISGIVRYQCKLGYKGNLFTSVHTKNKGSLSHIDILDKYNENAEYYQECFRIASKCVLSCKLMNKGAIGGIMAYLHLNLGYSSDVVRDFFYNLHQYKTTEDFYPCKIIRERIINCALRHQKMNPRYLHNLLVEAWKLWVKGENKKKLVADEKELLNFE